MYDFHHVNLQPGTVYDITITYGQIYPPVTNIINLCLNQTISWQFTTLTLSSEVAAWDSNNDSIIERSEAVNAVVAYFSGFLDKATAVKVVALFLFQYPD